MEISAIRRKNFVQILNKFRTNTEFSNISGISLAQLSQLSSGNTKYNIGSAMARKIEEAAGKPIGWLDVYHEEATEQLDSDTDLVVQTVCIVNNLIEQHDSSALIINNMVYRQLLRDAIKTARSIGSTCESQVKHTLLGSLISINKAQ